MWLLSFPVAVGTSGGGWAIQMVCGRGRQGIDGADSAKDPLPLPLPTQYKMMAFLWGEQAVQSSKRA